MAREKAQADIHPALFQRGLDFSRGNFLRGETDAGMARGEHAQEIRHQSDIEDGNNTHVQSAAHLPRLGI